MTHLSMEGSLVARTADNSRRRWGLLPVSWSCCRTATTTGSSIPSKSILGNSPGDGGGVCSPLITRCWVSSRKRTEFRRSRARGGLAGLGEVDPELCDRFALFVGGSLVEEWSFCLCDIGDAEGGERLSDDRAELLGSWMPSIGSDSDFLRVLYGMMKSVQENRTPREEGDGMGGSGEDSVEGEKAVTDGNDKKSVGPGRSCVPVGQWWDRRLMWKAGADMLLESWSGGLLLAGVMACRA
jgi:hypothetical protein